MKTFLTIAMLCLGVASNCEAGRPVSYQVVQKLKEVEPVYKQLQDSVVNAVASAKLNTAAQTDAFYRAVIADKETSLAQSVQMEDQFIFQLDNQASSVDASCIGFLRTLVDSNMNVAGVGFTQCVKKVEKNLKAEVDKIYEVLLVDESDVFGLSLLDVFDGENMIADPAKIIAKLQAKEQDISRISLSFVSEINSAVDVFASRLKDMSGSYKSCLLENESILKVSYDNAKTQLTGICQGTIV
ncbi:uncharacterized protein LOC118461648 [Anopheles albimanus]|uniref:Protein TsetseEP domain-containing protein n=1 Tax=Anopheles albimanus TaxID=7167 RepID=A0A1I8JSL8_ANOAL|nr:uncharacterized protein LOC118461647 [Anopheles albimanus]XP_035783116.1 uncharacterized protein LOC118461648 [Anopheles albimanus]